MRKWILRILAVLAVAVAIFLVLVALQPSEFRVTRTGIVHASPEKAFAQVNDFHGWGEWSPWAKLDPNAKNTFEGPTAGTGAVFKWDGNADVGAGQMTIVDSKPNERILIKLAFTRPMVSECDTEFAFKPEGENTAVTWTMSGKNDFVGKAFCLFMNMDKMIGSDFERGLANMDEAAKKAPK